MTKNQEPIERIDPLEDVVGDLFVNRQAELDVFWDWANSIPNRLLNSLALIGRRRTGKTAILVKLYNRLFYEQTRVMPIYITFARYLEQRKPITAYEFAEEYFAGYITSFLAFRHRRPDIFGEQLELPALQEIAQAVKDELGLTLFDRYYGHLTERGSYSIVQWAINMPRGLAYLNKIPTAMIVDEFQILTNVYDEETGRHLAVTDSFQWAVETRWAPMLVSGSAVSIFVEDALGGLLSGRFHYYYLDPLTEGHAYDLVFRLGQAFGVAINEDLAEAICQISGGQPYTIYCLITSNSPHKSQYPSTKALEEVVTFELINPRGKLAQHYLREFAKYSQQLNDGQLTRRVMLWATKFPGQLIDADQIAQAVGSTEVQVRQALQKLSLIDVVETTGLISYLGPTDPMLRRFIEYQHNTEIEKLTPPEALKDWRAEY